MNGKVEPFDELPSRYRVNVDHVDFPLALHADQKSLLDDSDIRDLAAFLKTLDDGYSRESAGKFSP